MSDTTRVHAPTESTTTAAVRESARVLPAPAASRSVASIARRAGVIALWVLGVYLVGRAVAEPFVIDLNDPSTYRHDWGGPTLAGVLAVHCGSGLVALAFLTAALRRRFGGAARARLDGGASR